MIKKIIYVLGILALGFVIFNNLIQTVEVIKINRDYLIGLLVALISSLFYGIANL